MYYTFKLAPPAQETPARPPSPLDDSWVKYQHWQEWELAFMRECFAKDTHPSGVMFDDWAWQMTEKKFRCINLPIEGNHNLVQEWYERYNRKLRNWFQTARSKLKRQAASLEETTLNISTSASRAPTNVHNIPQRAPSLLAPHQIKQEEFDVTIPPYDADVVEGAKALMRMRYDHRRF